MRGQSEHRATPLLARGLVAQLAGCGGDVHDIGTSQTCGTDSSPYLGGHGGIAVRCAPQTQSPSGLTG